MTTPKPCKMSLATGTLIELFRTTPPPPLARRQEAVRSIPPPPLHPPPLTILKMVPPPPLPSHLNRIGPTAAALLSGGQGTANSGHGTTNQPRNAKGVSETGYQDTARGQGRKGSSKTARLNHCGPRDGRSRDTADGPLSRSRDTADGSASRSRDAVDSPLSRSRDSEVTDDAAEEAELVDVLKHLVNLFTMTSQVKAALGRVRLKADDTGIQHQLSRTRALVDTFREQLARRTVTLGRLVPPDTTGRPEIPRELRTKDPAGGDVSPPTPQPAARAADGGPRATQEAISSLQALVTGAAAADPPAAGTCRWSSRVKRRFLAARRPARRVGERLKAPHTANARWQGPAAAGGGPSSSRPSSPPSPGRSSSGEEEEEEEDGRPTDYLTPGCYDLDGAGRPVCAGDPAAAGGGPGAAAGLFGVPLSVMMAEAAKKKKRQLNSGCQGGPAGGPRSAGAGAGAGAEPGRKDRSWLTTAAAPPAPAQAPRVPQVPVPRAGPQPGLAETLDSLRRLAVGGDQRPAAAGLGSSPRSSESTRSCSGGSEPAGSSPRGPDGAGSSPRGPDGADSSPRGTDGADSSPRGTDGAGSSPRGPGGADSSPRGPDGADSSPRGTDGADSELSGTPRDADGPAEDWMTSSFDEDWFLSTEREEREEEEARRRAEEEDQRRRRGGGAEGEESQTRREARRHESESESELSGQTSALRATPQSQ